MKILTNLSATPEPIEATWTGGSRVIGQTVCDEPAPGVLRLVTLRASGLIIRRGENGVHIPLPELLKLAEAHCPELSPDSKNAEKLDLKATKIQDKRSPKPKRRW